MLSQLRESDLPVGDASRMLELKQWSTWAAAHIPTSVDYMGSKASKLDFNSPSKTVLSNTLFRWRMLNVVHTARIVWMPVL